ncbi:MAG: hypothetical protein ACFCVK_04730 [Acidimicrobiales bacterium]
MIDRGMQAHRRQMVIGPAPKAPSPHWLVEQLACGRWLSRCPELRAKVVEGSDGVQWLLLGLAVQSDPRRPHPEVQLAEIVRDEVETACSTWAGRYLLFGDGHMRTDATAQLPCHWTAADPRGVWLSSSPALVAEVAGTGAPSPGELEYGFGVSWIAPPRGRRSGIRRLLPSQSLDVAARRPRPRRLLLLDTDADTGSDPIRVLAGLLTEAVRRLPSTLPVHLGLSAGADSRAVLGAALGSGRAVDPFTRRAARMTVADRLLPRRLCSHFDLPHRELLPQAADPERWMLARRHTDDHVSAGDARPFVSAARDSLVGVEIGGQGFGVGKALLRNLPAGIGNVQRTTELLLIELGAGPEDPSRIGMSEWLDWVVAHPEPGLDWRDRFYLEQRMAGWQASKEQLYDLDSHERMSPLNSAAALTALLRPDESERRDGSAQRELLRTLDLRLLSEPINPPGRSFPQWRRLEHGLRVRWPGR